MHAHPAPLFPIIAVGPFYEWGIDFMTCTLDFSRGHKYIIMAVDYFTKWVEAIPAIKNIGETITIFIFNKIITRFRVARHLFTDHGTHFKNTMMKELATKLGFRHDQSCPYYP